MTLNSPLNSTGIAVTGKWQQAVPVADGKQKVVFLLTMPANFAQIDADDNNHVILDFAAIARTEDMAFSLGDQGAEPAFFMS